jgi:hypothetical protein
MKHITFVTGDTLPAIYGTLKNDDGVVINITGYEIKLHIRLPELVLIKTAVIVDAAAGTFKFSIAGDATNLAILDDGDDLSGIGSPAQFSDDVIEQSRSTWYIGASEIVAAGGKGNFFMFF